MTDTPDQGLAESQVPVEPQGSVDPQVSETTPLSSGLQARLDAARERAAQAANQSVLAVIDAFQQKLDEVFGDLVTELGITVDVGKFPTSPHGHFVWNGQHNVYLAHIINEWHVVFQPKTATNRTLNLRDMTLEQRQDALLLALQNS